MHDAGLGGQLLAGRGALLTGGGVGLHNRRDLVNALRDLGNGIGLVLHGLGHAVHHLYYAVGQHSGLLQGLRDLAHHIRAAVDGTDGVLNEVLGRLGGLVGLGGQVAHLVGHHGKALAGGVVQGQDIGLESDVLNGGDDLADLLR